MKRWIKYPPLEKCYVDIAIHSEDVFPDGYLATGDDEADAACIKEIYDRLENGDLWAWCVVEVIVGYDGLVGSAVLGGCSYDDEDSFKEGGYYEDMVLEAYEDLKSELRGAVHQARRVLREYTCEPT